jgi:cytochrome c peroxidase
MKATQFPVLSLALSVAAFGCKKSEEQKPAAPPAAPAPAPATPPAAPPRVSAPKMPALQLPDDPQRADKIALGNTLFFDKRLSGDGSRACYSCHMNENGTGGADPVATGLDGKKLPRHSPVLWNLAYSKTFAWDGRAATLEAHTKGGIGGPSVGVGTDPKQLQSKVDELLKIKGYKKLFAAAFPKQPPTIDHVAQALAEYQRTLLCTDTAYDRFAGGDATALTESQQRGWAIFNGEGMCMTCHTPPYFTMAAMSDAAFFNIGIGTQKPEAEVDIGRKKVTSADADWAAFKVPTLRNISKSAPYFHDGSVATLGEAVKLMASGGIANPRRTPLMADRGLSSEKLSDLVAFLGALECQGKLSPPAEMPK